MKGWLPLSDYSTKYKVSISTLRRRIRADKVECFFEDGKYLLRDAPLKQHRVVRQTSASTSTDSSAPPPKKHEESVEGEKVPHPEPKDPLEEGGSFLATANRMLNELKKAYSVILQEKEMQVLQLRDEVADLQTLVRVLEEENARLRQSMEESRSLDNWLSSTHME